MKTMSALFMLILMGCAPEQYVPPIRELNPDALPDCSAQVLHPRPKSAKYITFKAPHSTLYIRERGPAYMCLKRDK